LGVHPWKDKNTNFTELIGYKYLRFRPKKTPLTFVKGVFDYL